MSDGGREVPEEVADRLSGNGIVKATRICTDVQVTGFSEPTDFEEAKIGLNHVDQKPVDTIYVLDNSSGNAEVLAGKVLSEKISKEIVRELL